MVGLVGLQLAVGTVGGWPMLGGGLAVVFVAGTVLAAATTDRVSTRWVALMGGLHVLGALLATM